MCDSAPWISTSRSTTVTTYILTSLSLNFEFVLENIEFEKVHFNLRCRQHTSHIGIFMNYSNSKGGRNKFFLG